MTNYKNNGLAFPNNLSICKTITTRQWGEGVGGCRRSSLSAMFSCIVTTRLYGELQWSDSMRENVFCNLSSQWRHSVDIIYHLSVSDSWHGELLEAQLYRNNCDLTCLRMRFSFQEPVLTKHRHVVMLRQLCRNVKSVI